MSVQKTLLSVLLGLAVIVPAHAINVKSDMRGAWGYSKRDNCPTETANDFIIAGSLGMTGQHGTHGDEWAVVGMIAKKIVAHGGYFCPYQLQCANKRKNKKAWTMYYRPNGYNDGKCVWLCEPGYAGENCAAVSGEPSCDHSSYTITSGGKFAGLTLKTSGGNELQVESEVAGFDAWYQSKKYCGMDDGSKKNEIDILLGVTKFLEHGVEIGPVRVKCQRVNWKNNDSYVESVMREKGGEFVLACASGYEPNAQKTDCVPSSHCASTAAAATSDPTAGVTFCDGFPKENFNEAQHYLVPDGSCSKYFCTQTGRAFVAGGFECVECATGVKGGPHPRNGQCVVCQTGQYFDKTTGQCQSAAAYSKTDMVYGAGKTKSQVPNVMEQCWTIITPDEYKRCVIEGKVTTDEPVVDDDEESSGNSGGNSTSGSNPKVTPPAPGDRVPVGTVPGTGSSSGGSSAAGGSGGSTGTIAGGGSSGGGAVVDDLPSLPVNNGFEKIQTPVQYMQTARTPVKRKSVR